MKLYAEAYTRVERRIGSMQIGRNRYARAYNGEDLGQVLSGGSPDQAGRLDFAMGSGESPEPQ